MHFPVMEKKPRKSWEFFQVTSLSPFIHSSQVCYLPPKKGKKNHAFRTAWKVLEYETGCDFFLPVKLWCLCENEHRFKLTGWFYTNYHNIDYRRSQWWQAVGMATKFKCLCKFIKGSRIRSWEILTGEDLTQRGRGDRGSEISFRA